MSSDYMPMATPGPLSDVREGFTPQTGDLRGQLPTPSFTMITAFDNGQTLDGATNELMAPKFGNCC